MAQIKEHIKTPEKELSEEEVANLSNAEIKTLVIKMLTEMIDYACKIEEDMKAIQSEKIYIQGKKQWRERSPDSNQQFGQKEENKHSTGTEWRNNF